MKAVDLKPAKIAKSVRGKSDSRAVMDCIRRIVRALHVGSQMAQKSAGLSSAQLFVLQTLANSGAMSINELAARTHTHQSSVSAVVSRLVAAKLISRKISGADARRLELTVTHAGRVLTSRFVTPQEQLIRALDQLKPPRLADLRSLLEEVIALSGLETKTPPMFFESRRRPG